MTVILHKEAPLFSAKQRASLATAANFHYLRFHQISLHNQTPFPPRRVQGWKMKAPEGGEWVAAEG